MARAPRGRHLQDADVDRGALYVHQTELHKGVSEGWIGERHAMGEIEGGRAGGYLSWLAGAHAADCGLGAGLVH